MSAICGLPILECVYCLACARWVWKKCLYTAGYESENWGLATAQEFEPVPRICRLKFTINHNFKHEWICSCIRTIGLNLTIISFDLWAIYIAYTALWKITDITHIYILNPVTTLFVTDYITLGWRERFNKTGHGMQKLWSTRFVIRHIYTTLTS